MKKQNKIDNYRLQYNIIFGMLIFVYLYIVLIALVCCVKIYRSVVLYLYVS